MTWFLGQNRDLAESQSRWLGHQPILQSPLVIAEVAKACGLAGVDRRALPKASIHWTQQAAE